MITSRMFQIGVSDNCDLEWTLLKLKSLLRSRQCLQLSLEDVLQLIIDLSGHNTQKIAIVYQDQYEIYWLLSAIRR